MRPPIRWAGSKLKSLSLLRSIYNAAPGRYVEAFAGSACLFFDVSPPKALINDLNPDLIRAYRCLRDDRDRLLLKLRSIPTAKSAYYELRARDPESMGECDAAARFFYLNRFCFNGLYRTNRSGRFNVPYGHLRKKERIDFELLVRASKLLQRAELLNADFERSVEAARQGDFVYLDPPYVGSGAGRLFAEYLPNSFSAPDLDRLEASLTALDRRGAHFALSYVNTKIIRKRFARWRILKTNVRRNIAGFSGARRISGELVVTNVRVVAC
jgi:DNA adenine methylase